MSLENLFNTLLKFSILLFMFYEIVLICILNLYWLFFRVKRYHNLAIFNQFFLISQMFTEIFSLEERITIFSWKFRCKTYKDVFELYHCWYGEPGQIPCFMGQHELDGDVRCWWSSRTFLIQHPNGSFEFVHKELGINDPESYFKEAWQRNKFIEFE